MPFPEGALTTDVEVSNLLKLGCEGCSQETWKKYLKGGIDLTSREFEELGSVDPATLAAVAAVNPIEKSGT